ncbi:hypothetical protein [Microbacterium panaciterrae]|uniref:Uncharacterized protein n=1 Tax=Microbacterium panaciterrae TaxID=985759 RepID=A0ABP8PVC4_9MICO
MHIYFSTKFSPSDRGRWLDDEDAPVIDGFAINLEQLLKRIEEDCIREVADYAKEAGWIASENLEEFYRHNTQVFKMPLDTMVRASTLKAIYGDRYDRKLEVTQWGEIGAPISIPELDALRAREAFRVANRDADDPLRQIVEAAQVQRTKRTPDPGVLFIAYDYAPLFKRTIGAFQTYDAAVAAAPADATICELDADGSTSLRRGKMLRGHFAEQGWGYASGYAPSDRKTQQVPGT